MHDVECSLSLHTLAQQHVSKGACTTTGRLMHPCMTAGHVSPSAYQSGMLHPATIACLKQIPSPAAAAPILLLGSCLQAFCNGYVCICQPDGGGQHEHVSVVHHGKSDTHLLA